MLKRDLHLFFRCLIPAAALTAVLAAVCAVAALALLRNAEEVYTPVKAAVVDGEDSILSRMLIRGVADTEYVSGLMEIVTCSEERAKEGLRSGDFAAVIELPADFVGGILTGEERRGRITLSASAAANAEVVASAAAFGETMLSAGQFAVFSGETLIREHALGEAFHKAYLAHVNSVLLGEAMAAGNGYFTVETTGYAGTNLSSVAYYASLWLTLVISLGGMMFESLYRTDLKRSMLCRLRGAGVKDGAFLAGKLLLPFLFELAVMPGALWALSEWIEIEWSAAAVFFAALGALLSAFVSAAVVMCAEKGGTLLAVSGAVSLFLCGGIVPRQMLPRAVTVLGDLTPLGVGRRLLGPVFGGAPEGAAVIAAAVYTAAAITLLCLRLRDIRVGGEEA